MRLSIRAATRNFRYKRPPLPDPLLQRRRESSHASQVRRFTSRPRVLARAWASFVWVLWLGALLMLLVPVRIWAEGETNQFRFLRLRLQAGKVTLIESSVVPGTLKPQHDAAETEPLVVSLESNSGEVRWSLSIADPSRQRYEYEDPDRPGFIRSKTVQLDDVEFIVRAPLTPGAQHVAVYRKEQTAPQAKAGQPATEKRLLALIPLPPETSK